MAANQGPSSASANNKPNSVKENTTVDPTIASKVDQIKALPYATSIVSEDVIERNFGYKIIRQQVSSGRTSMIYKCESVRYPESYCLIKPYKLGRDKIKVTLREETCQIMRFVTAKCPQIISTYDLFYTNEKIYLMCDWAQKGEVLGNLKQKSIRFTEEVLRQWTIDLLNGVQFLHSNGICHRNIAPSCLLLTKMDRIKIGILSDACIYCKSDGQLIKQKWEKFSRDTNWNQAPEVAKLKPFDPRRADIWSIGATIYWFICRSYPIDYRSNQRLTKQLDYRTSFLQKKVSSKCQKFVKKMLTFQPPQRPTIQQALELEWVLAPGSPAAGASVSNKTPPAGGSPAQNSTSRRGQTLPAANRGAGGVSPELQPPAELANNEPGEAAPVEEAANPVGVTGGQEYNGPVERLPENSTSTTAAANVPPMSSQQQQQQQTTEQTGQQMSPE